LTYDAKLARAGNHRAKIELVDTYLGSGRRGTAKFES
jgi:hypothetical protein